MPKYNGNYYITTTIQQEVPEYNFLLELELSYANNNKYCDLTVQIITPDDSVEFKISTEKAKELRDFLNFAIQD